jgi:hypothetical protein
VQKVREAAARTQSTNNLRQIGIALHQADNTHKVLPPLFGSYPATNWNSLYRSGGSGAAWGPLLFLILPYIEQDSLLKSTPLAYGAGSYFNWNSGTPVAYSVVVSVYLNPSDPSLSGNVQQDIAHGGYGANAQVFGLVDANGSLRSFGLGLDGFGVSSISRSFSDGTSNTILFAEKYARCDPTRAPAFVWNGTWWNYGWLVDSTWQLGAPIFACDYFGRYPNGIGAASRFQAKPAWDGPACDPVRAQASTSGGIHVLLGDASVRALGSDLSGATWWAACTPNRGDTVGSDW